MAIIRDASIANNKTHKNKYAIVVYLDDTEKCKDEFSWLWKSWLMWGINKKWDLIVFVNPTCEDEIKEKYMVDGLVIIPQVPMQSLNSFWKDYKFVNSFGMFRDNVLEKFSDYTHLLKTDCDVFLSPGFKYHSPETYIQIGHGQHVHHSLDNKLIDDIQNKLNSVRDLFKLKDRRLRNVGASFMSDTNRVISVTRAHFTITEHLLKHGWKEGDMGNWPGWYKGVASMYAIELAVNHYCAPLNIQQNRIDMYCGPAQIQLSDLKYHAWQQNQQDFDKMQWFIEKEIKKLKNGPERDGLIKKYLRESKFCSDIQFTKFPKTAGKYCLMIANHDIEHLKKMAKLFKFNF